MIVVDTNVILSLCIEDAYTARAVALFERDVDWCAPMLWRSEFRNALAVLMRRRGLSLASANEAIGDAESAIREYRIDSSVVLDLVAQSTCSAYDCEFVALAQALGTTLITVDAQIIRDFPRIARSL